MSIKKEDRALNMHLRRDLADGLDAIADQYTPFRKRHLVEAAIAALLRATDHERREWLLRLTGPEWANEPQSQPELLGRQLAAETRRARKLPKRGEGNQSAG